jgi:hypothetical protein
MARKIFLAMGSLLMSEIRRSGTWHFGHTASIPNTLRNKSDHLMYLDLRLGLSWPGSGGPASWGLGTTSLRKAACEESTPQYRTVCFRGDGDGRGEAAWGGGRVGRP